jgi:hypothetical protein
MRRSFLALVALLAALFYVSQPPAEAAFIPFPGPQCTSSVQINQITGTDLKTFTNTGYICFVFLVSATAQNVSLVNGTGTVCATGTNGMLGGTTAATGQNLAANEGFVLGVGFYPITQTSTTAQHMCLLQSSTGQISGIIRYADQ